MSNSNLQEHRQLVAGSITYQSKSGIESINDTFLANKPRKLRRHHGSLSSTESEAIEKDLAKEEARERELAKEKDVSSAEQSKHEMEDVENNPQESKPVSITSSNNSENQNEKQMSVLIEDMIDTNQDSTVKEIKSENLEERADVQETPEEPNQNEASDQEFVRENFAITPKDSLDVTYNKQSIDRVPNTESVEPIIIPSYEETPTIPEPSASHSEAKLEPPVEEPEESKTSNVKETIGDEVKVPPVVETNKKEKKKKGFFSRLSLHSLAFKTKNKK